MTAFTVDYALQRTNMVESQVRPSDITDRRIIRAMLNLPRELFCPEAQRAIVYNDLDVLVQAAGAGGPARYLTATRVLAKLIQALDVEPADQVLHIGSGVGYGTAVLARLAGKVTALEQNADLATVAQATLVSLSVANVTHVSGLLAAGHVAAAPYDAILIEGAVGEVPAALLDQLRDGGRLAAITGTGRSGRLTQWRRRGNMCDARVILDAAAPALPGFEKAASFVF